MSFWKSWFGRKSVDLVDSGKKPPYLEAKIEEWVDRLKPLARDAWLPETVVHQAEHSSHTKFGGLPYLTQESPWPQCPNCGDHMQLFLQFNLQDHPTKPEEGIIQLFYCTHSDPHCESDLEAFFPFSAAVVCRRVEYKGESLQVTPQIEELFEEKRLNRWEHILDYPTAEEYDDLGLEQMDDEVGEWLYENGYAATSGDKLGGWPLWIQGVEYPHNPQTGEVMQLLFQLDSEVNLPFMFGDSGVGHLTVSPNDEKLMAFGWACY
ncbi:DUF1963 domain-containing protein [bacterium SCSIO 12741]|nr:DUF1963 domain-containing protein [bacterium SCSIO 12741]